MPTYLKSVSNILHSPSTGLQAILEKASVLQQINQNLCLFLSEPLNQHIVLANVRDDTAVIMADSSVWLTKARYQGASILRFLTHDVGLTKLKKVQFKVQPHTGNTALQAPNPDVSVKAAQWLNQAADDIQDPGLKAAIKQLSNNFQPKV